MVNTSDNSGAAGGTDKAQTAGAGDKSTVRVNVFLSAETHKRLKVYCAQRNVAIKDQVAAMLDKAFAERPVEPT